MFILSSLDRWFVFDISVFVDVIVFVCFMGIGKSLVFTATKSKYVFEDIVLSATALFVFIIDCSRKRMNLSKITLYSSGRGKLVNKKSLLMTSRLSSRGGAD